MKFLKDIYDFMFAPPGTFDAESGLFDACNDNVYAHSAPALTINPATNLPMIEDAGIDVGGSPFGIDIHHSFDTASASDHSAYENNSVALIESSWSEPQFCGGFDTSFSSLDENGMWEF